MLVTNHEFIRRITTAVGITENRAVASHGKPYVIARRRGGLPGLHIAVADVPLWPGGERLLSAELTAV